MCTKTSCCFIILLVPIINAVSGERQAGRMRMIEKQIVARGIKNTRVLNAMKSVPRHVFVPTEHQKEAYNDYPLGIGHGQTISQPYIVAYMTEQLGLKGHEKVLEIGTGSGYQAAVLGALADSVFSIEIICELERTAARILKKQGYDNVFTKCGDGYQGWLEHAPFDAVMLTAAPEKIPQPLIKQLKTGGKLIAPVGNFFQELVLITKTENGIKKERLIGVRFVPMTGKARE